MKKRLGFTLIELLIVVSILGMVMIAITQTLGSMLSGSGKANALQSVKENGQFAIATIERLARSARSVSCPVDGSVTIVVPGTPSDATYVIVKNGTQLTRSKDGGASVALTSSDVQVDVFTCTLTAGAAGEPQVANLVLTLQKLGVTVDQQALSQTFQTTVSLRTY